MTAQSSTISSPKTPFGLTVRAYRRLKEVSLGYALLAPAFILLAIFEFYPLFFGLYISMCDWRLSCVNFIGFDNYTRALGDPAMWQSLLITATYSIIAIPLQLGFGLILAYLLFQKVKGLQLFRVFFFMPYITTTVASAAIWAFIYNPTYGPLNKLIEALGGQPQKWLGESTGIFQMVANSFGATLPETFAGPSLALVSLVLYTTWVFVGYDIVIFLAGLGNIPGELYDAAKVDGAQGWKLFRYITFPLLSPTTFFLLIITVIGTFKAFNHIYIMTQGGPANATRTASILIFNQMVTFNRYGYSAALSFIVFLAILLLTVAQNRIAGKRVIYE